jgi:hypothetical protein
MKFRHTYIVTYKPVARQRQRKKQVAAVARQRSARKNGSTVGSGVFCVVWSEAT